MTSAPDEKWQPFNCFFQSGRAKDLSASLYKVETSIKAWLLTDDDDDDDDDLLSLFRNFAEIRRTRKEGLCYLCAVVSEC